jgi:hypothetical protein
MVDTQQLGQELREYLRRTFGDELVRLIAEPPGVRVGERVLYRLKGGDEAARREVTPHQLAQLHSKLVEIAESTGLDESAVVTDPPKSSGLPDPRFIDLPGADIVWDSDLHRWLRSEDPLPSRDFPLEWAVGILLTPSQKMVAYLDFTHATVKAAFRVFYESQDEYHANEGAAVCARFKQFREKENALKASAAGQPDLVWIKLVQMDEKPLVVRTREAKLYDRFPRPLNKMARVLARVFKSPDD